MVDHFLHAQAEILLIAIRSSIASNRPVLAPDGTDSLALISFPVVSVFAVIITSTVGFPLESKISLA